MTFGLWHGIALLLTYLLNSVPFGYLIAKQAGVNIREHGSGNTGATNVARVVGKKAGITVLVLDFLKGFIPVFLAVNFLFPNEPWFHLFIAITAIIGHCYSVFLKFSGGKASISGLACLFALQPLFATGIAILVFTIFKISRMVSLAAISAAVIVPIAMYLLNCPLPYTLYGLFTAIVLIYKHRANIGRLIQGTENKL